MAEPKCDGWIGSGARTEPKTIRPGSTLVFKGVATHRDACGWSVLIAGGRDESYFTDEEVRLAEHIPAPKTFKRGDWVRHLREAQFTRGVVIKAGDAEVSVSWDVTPEINYRHVPSNLEHIELPE